MTTYMEGQAPVAVHPLEGRVHADIGISPWDGTDFALGDGAGREHVSVLVPVKDYIVQQKKLAAATVASDPVLRSLTSTWADLEKASQPIRERRAVEQETEKWESTPGHVRYAREQRARAEIGDATTTAVNAKLTALDALE